MQRINYLDGHRGVAILLVIFYHAFSRWPEITPYGDNYANFPVFQYGYIGVQLFFLISGFVILMTLEKCNSIWEFLYRRWLRLFPAMLICSLIIFFTTQIFYERPNAQPDVKDILPGLTFIEPYIWTKLTGSSFQSLEGAFWSLYVEFKFYVLASFLYFFWGRKALVIMLSLCFLSSFLFEKLYLLTDNKLLSYAFSVSKILSFKHFGWFATGAAYYIFTASGNKKWFYTGVFISLISSMIEFRFNVGDLIFGIIISLFFASSIVNVKIQKVLGNKYLLFFGFVSYPLYLLHENMMISIISKLDQIMLVIPDFLLPFIAISFISTLSFIVAKYFERLVKKNIDILITMIFSSIVILKPKSKK
ncbi:MAG: acyltransferase [Flavobacteriaceae bacterium]|nr:acyltransferase [Flavobacteriaceae bacterium]